MSCPFSLTSSKRVTHPCFQENQELSEEGKNPLLSAVSLLQCCLWLFHDFEIYHKGSDYYKSYIMPQKCPPSFRQLEVNSSLETFYNCPQFPSFLSSKLLTHGQRSAAGSHPCHCLSAAETASLLGFLTPSECGFHTVFHTVIDNCVLCLQAVYLQICIHDSVYMTEPSMEKTNSPLKPSA
jgi:hypothetical protein